MSEPEQEEQRAVNQDNSAPVQSGVKRYQLRQKMVSLGQDYWIENEHGEKVYKVDGKVFTIHKTFFFEDAHGKKLAKLKKLILTLKEIIEIEGPDGEQLAKVTKDLFTPLKEHFVVKVKNSPDLEIHGNILDHEYSINNENQKIAQVSKKWLSIRDSYAVEIEPGQDDVLVLAIVTSIDEMTHGTR